MGTQGLLTGRDALAASHGSGDEAFAKLRTCGRGRTYASIYPRLSFASHHQILTRTRMLGPEEEPPADFTRKNDNTHKIKRVINYCTHHHPLGRIDFDVHGQIKSDTRPNRFLKNGQTTQMAAQIG